jgi:nucleobase transporter 1/2
MIIFEGYAVAPMLGGMLAASMIESVGDYYACARLSGGPPPTPGIISRGLGCEGIGVLIAGLVGTGNGTTSYSENIGAISITGVGSRAVVQCGAVIIIVVSLIGKVGALFAMMPGAMTSGLYCALFGSIVAVGLSNLQYVDLNSPRNQFIIGFAIFNSLSVARPAGYLRTQPSNPFGSTDAAAVAFAILSSPMIIAFICAFTFDNTVAGTREERGLHVWDKIQVRVSSVLTICRLTYSCTVCSSNHKKAVYSQFHLLFVLTSLPMSTTIQNMSKSTLYR